MCFRIFGCLGHGGVTFEDCKEVLGWAARYCPFCDEFVEDDLEVVVFHLEGLACDRGNRSLAH